MLSISVSLPCCPAIDSHHPLQYASRRALYSRTSLTVTAVSIEPEYVTGFQIKHTSSVISVVFVVLQAASGASISSVTQTLHVTRPFLCLFDCLFIASRLLAGGIGLP